MGKMKQGILGGVSGSIGKMIGSSWKGINYFRRKPVHYNDANTEKQIAQRTKLSACVHFACSIKESIIHPVWNPKAEKMSGFNLFVKTNLNAFNVRGEIDDFNQLQISIGDLPLPGKLLIRDDPANKGGITLSWNNNAGFGSALASDKLNVLVISEGVARALSELNITRDAEAANILLPFGAGFEAQVYVFFHSEESKSYSVDQHATIMVS